MEDMQDKVVNPEVVNGLVALLRPIADDEWIVGHRGSEWLGLAPDLEEDMAFSSVSQDELGHAQFYYAILASLGLPDVDSQVYARPAEEWTNARFLEDPNGDWAHTVARRYFYEVFDDLRHAVLATSSYQPLRDGVKKIRREEQYHLRHFDTWFDMLAMGSEESRRRLRHGIDGIWPTLGDLFSWGASESFLSDLGLDALSGERVKAQWEKRLEAKFRALGLPWPGPVPRALADGRKGQHGKDMEDLLRVMTEVWRMDREASW